MPTPFVPCWNEVRWLHPLMSASAVDWGAQRRESEHVPLGRWVGEWDCRPDILTSLRTRDGKG